MADVSKPKTIDSLGVEPSQSYIEWLKESEEIRSLIQKYYPETEIARIKPLESEIEKIIRSLNFVIQTATYEEVVPFSYNLFQEVLIKTIGDSQKLESLLKKIEKLPENFSKKEKDNLIETLKILFELNKNSEYLFSNLKKYHKG
ncbi:MAG: hypothetical protein AMS24_03100 [Chlamydiae bacterium SM23_39]|nr:MAG: hypothetical protein AMS24_03100 [Chlamydiae bacterium SM23_39]